MLGDGVAAVADTDAWARGPGSSQMRPRRMLSRLVRWLPTLPLLESVSFKTTEIQIHVDVIFSAYKLQHLRKN